MTGTTAAKMILLGALAAAFASSGCKTGKEAETAANAEHDPPEPTAKENLHGMYRYMADAGLFIDCASGQRWPVATEGDNANLERAYGAARSAPGAPLLVTVEGRLEPRPKIDGPGQETTLIVERFVKTWPEETCGTIGKAMLEGMRWELLELHGKAIRMRATDKVPYLELSAKKSSAYGFGGCNRFFGSYEVSGDSLELGSMGATRMACPEGMQQEQELFAVLAATTRYEVHGSRLLLFAGDTLLARFKARDKPEQP